MKWAPHPDRKVKQDFLEEDVSSLRLEDKWGLARPRGTLIWNCFQAERGHGQMSEVDRPHDHVAGETRAGQEQKEISGFKGGK